MNTLRDYFTNEMINWLEANNLKYKEVNIKLDKGSLIILFNDNFCFKIYDRLGHGFGVNINVAEEHDEGIYDNDSFNLTWAYEYLNIRETASFNSRKKNQYLQNLPSLVNDLKNIIPLLNRMDSLEWNKMKEWISKEASTRFT
jgi:hypothetical protein